MTQQSAKGLRLAAGVPARLLDAAGAPVELPGLVNTWEPDDRGAFPYAVIEAVDPETVQIDPLAFM